MKMKMKMRMMSPVNPPRTPTRGSCHSPLPDAKPSAILSAEHQKGKPVISLFTAICLVVANMIGTGVFTSLGFQIGDLPSGFVILLLWLIGGICAFCGALCYAELSAALPRSGGEYHLIGRTLHPALGFLAGWLSSTVGFAAPIALAAMALGRYASEIIWSGQDFYLAIQIPGTTWTTPPLTSDTLIALAVVGAVTLIHFRGAGIGSWFQNTATTLKLALIAFILFQGMTFTPGEAVHFTLQPGDGVLLHSTAFAVSLIYVMYAYSGWNAAAYVVGEIRDPARNVPRALLIGTGLVTVLYVGLNAVFLHTTPAAALKGKIEVGMIAGEYIFGETGGRIIGGFICLGLIASCSAMIWVGSRVSATMGEDIVALRFLSIRDRGGAPRVALLVQLFIIAVLLTTATFEKVLVYIQFGLTLCSVLTVIGLIRLRIREPNLPRPFRVPLFPVAPIIFLGVSGWMLYHIWRDKRDETLAGLVTIALGLVIYFVSPRPSAAKSSPP
jgi:basic amino acid/polyamine antiporter, APA family